MKQNTIVILGGSFSGPTAAAKAREFDEKSRIILIEKTEKINFAQSGLSYFLSNEIGSMEEFKKERSEFFKEAYNIEIRTETEVVKIDPKKKEVFLKGKFEGTLKYDSLIYALGAESSLPDKLPLKLLNLIFFRTARDLEIIQKNLSEEKKRVAVIGSGPFGLEACDGLIRSGFEVTLIEKRDSLLPASGKISSKMIENELKNKCKIFKSAEIAKFEVSGPNIQSIVLKNGILIPVDFVISAIGIKPNTKLLSSVGAKTTKDGALIVNSFGKTSLPNIFACGAGCAVSHVVSKKPVWMAQAAISDKLAQIAGANATGNKLTIGHSLNTLLLRVGNISYGKTGIGYTPSPKVGLTTIFAPSKEYYMSGAKDIMIQLIWDKKTGIVLGAEIAGENGVDKRLDALAFAIESKSTIQTLSTIDLGYEPPFSPARDPINVAGTVALYEKKNFVKTISPMILAKNLSKYYIVDLSSAPTENTSAIANSKKLPLEDIRKHISDIPKTKQIVTVSETGRRGYLGYRILIQNGYRDVFNLSGGLRAYNLSL